MEKHILDRLPLSSSQYINVLGRTWDIAFYGKTKQTRTVGVLEGPGLIRKSFGEPMFL